MPQQSLTDDVYCVILDNRVGEKRLAHGLQLRMRIRFVGCIQFDVENLSLPNSVKGVKSQTSERPRDGLPLRVKNARFEGNGDSRAHKRTY